MFSRLIAEDISNRITTDDRTDIEYPMSSPDGKPISDKNAIQDEIRDIMQRAYFVYPNYSEAEKGLARIREIKNSLLSGGYEINADFTETKSLTDVAIIILTEILDRRDEK